jgi:hypothetical protein
MHLSLKDDKRAVVAAAFNASEAAKLAHGSREGLAVRRLTNGVENGVGVA